MSSLSDLPNIGRVLENLLHGAGIDSAEQLRKTGAKEAFLRIRHTDPTACVHMLYGLEGAVRGVRDTMLSENTKRSLRDFHRALTSPKSNRTE